MYTLRLHTPLTRGAVYRELFRRNIDRKKYTRKSPIGVKPTVLYVMPVPQEMKHVLTVVCEVESKLRFRRVILKVFSDVTFVSSPKLFVIELRPLQLQTNLNGTSGNTYPTTK